MAKNYQNNRSTAVHSGIKKKAIGKFKEVPFRKMAPNIVTLMALCSGVTDVSMVFKRHSALGLDFYPDVFSRYGHASGSF